MWLISDLRTTAIQSHEHEPDGGWNQIEVSIFLHVVFEVVARHQLGIVDQGHF